MNFELLWLDILLIALFWVMVIAAGAGRFRSRLIRWPICWIGFAIPLAVLGYLLVAAILSQAVIQPDHIPFIGNDRLLFAGSLVVGYLIGLLAIVWRGSRRGSDRRPAAATWRRGPLLVGWLIAIVVGYTTVINMDLALRARCALLSIQLNTLYVAMTPAITSDSENAATLYQGAFERIADDPLEADVHNPPTGDRDDFDPNEPATLAFLSHEAPTITLLHQAAAMPACRFEQDMNVSMDLKGLNAVRNAANVLSLDAREEIARGHASSAISDITSIFGMSRHIGRRPTLVCSLVGMGIDALGCKMLEETLPIITRREELDALHIETFPPFGGAFRQSLWGEERYGLMCYGCMPDKSDDSNKSELPIEDIMTSRGIDGSLFRVFFLDLDGYLRLMKNLQNSAVKPYYQVRGHLLDAPGTPPSSDIMTAILGPSLTKSFQTAARIEAMDLCTQTGVAMTRYRLDHGSFPSTLDALMPAYLDAIPTDPFDGKPLRMVVNANQWIIYSIGPDDAGHRSDKPKAFGRTDIFFLLKSDHGGATSRPYTGHLP